MSDSKSGSNGSKARNVFVEFHVLRSHAPGNMNRDDLGTPKTAQFGGVRRLRVSSQCVKRTWRTSEWFQGVLGREQLGLDVLGVRTKRLPSMVRKELGDALDGQALDGLDEVLQRIGRSGAPSKEEEKTTAHLLFLTSEEVVAVREFAKKNKADLGKLAKLTAEAKSADEAKEGEPEAKPKKKSAKASKGDATAHGELLETLQRAFKAHMQESAPRNAVDVALFGRFVTSDEFRTVDAAMQVAHALGTQKVELEYDYFSAVDDKKEPGDDAGAGHIGESEFAQSVLYQYAVCDWRALLANLDGYADDAKRVAAQSMRALALAASRAVPSGKKNGTAPQNPADYVEVVLRRDAPISLANAFLRPVGAKDGDERDVMDHSIHRMRELAAKYQEAYSHDADVIGRFVLSVRDLSAPNKGESRFASLDALAGALAKALEGEA